MSNAAASFPNLKLPSQKYNRITSCLIYAALALIPQFAVAQLPEHNDPRWKTVKAVGDPYFARTGTYQLGLPGHQSGQLTCHVEVDVLKLRKPVDGFTWWMVSCKMSHVRRESKKTAPEVGFAGPFLGTAEIGTLRTHAPYVWVLHSILHTKDGHVKMAGPKTTEGESEVSMNFGGQISKDPSISAEYTHTFSLKDRIVKLEENTSRQTSWLLDMPNKGSQVLNASSWRADMLIQIPTDADLDVELFPSLQWRSQMQILGVDVTSNGSMPEQWHTKHMPIRVRATKEGEAIVDVSGKAWNSAEFFWLPDGGSLGRKLLFKIGSEQHVLTPISVRGSQFNKLNQYQNESRTIVVDFVNSKKGGWKFADPPEGGNLTRNLD